MTTAEEISEQLIHSRIQARHSAAQAALLRRLGNINHAEDAMQDAILKALQVWPISGIPTNIVAWLVTTGMNAFRDSYRRESRGREIVQSGVSHEPVADSEIDDQYSDIDDDVLRLIFMCCHPAIAAENQLALTLKTVLGFSQKEIARAFLIKEATLEQRLTRSKRKIASSGIPFELPEGEQLDKRLPPVQQVLYLIFNEGYHGSSGELLNESLCRNAITLTRSLCRVIPAPENFGLLALMLFQDARAPARLDSNNELVTLDKQDRGLWRKPQISEADVLLQKALRRKQSGVYQLQAAIAGLHSLAGSAEETDWMQIVGLYRLLMQHQGGPVITLNYAVALLFAEQLDQAGTLIKQLEGDLRNYSPYWAARAKLAEVLGSNAEATSALKKALNLSGSEQESRHYQLQLLKHGDRIEQGADSIH